MQVVKVRELTKDAEAVQCRKPRGMVGTQIRNDRRHHSRHERYLRIL